MDEKSKISNLTAQQKADLCHLGMSDEEKADGVETEENRAHLLLDVLAAKLPMDPKILSSLPTFLRTVGQDLRSVAGETLDNMLQDKQIGLPAIQKIRDYAKIIGKMSDAKYNHDVALAVYYAAIAHALIHHKKKITKYSYKELQISYAQLTTQDWIPQNLIQLFARAMKYCDEKTTSQEKSI